MALRFGDCHATHTRCSASRATPTRRRSRRPSARWPAELHPDVNTDDPEAEEKFKEAAEAYESFRTQTARDL